MVEGLRGGNEEQIANLGRDEFKPSFFLMQPKVLRSIPLGITSSIKPKNLAFFFETNRLTAS
jgi:hypothetical protein